MMHDAAPATAARISQRDRWSLDRVRARSSALDVALVSGVALVLGLIRLGTPSLWFDESYTVRQIQRSLAEQIEGYQPLYYWIVKPWTAAAGTSEWALRLPSVVGAMLACGLLVVLARKLFDRPVALVSGLLLATSPFLVKWSQQARGYSLVLAACLVATLLLLRALERGSRSAWAVYGVAFSAVLVLHAVAGVLLAPAHAVFVAQRRERMLPHGLLAASVIAAIGVPWVAQLTMRSAGEGNEMDWLTFPTLAVATRALLDVSGVAGLGVILATAGLLVLRRAGKPDLGIWLATWALAPFALALVVSTVREIYLDRYLVVAAPAFAMLAGAALVGVAARARIALVAAVTVATSVGLVLWYSPSERGNWRGEDWRSAAAMVVDRGSEARDVVVVPWWAHSAAEYYGAEVSDVSTADSIWVLNWSETGGDIRAVDRRALGFGDHHLVERLEFGRRVSAQLWKRSR